MTGPERDARDRAIRARHARGATDAQIAEAHRISRVEATRVCARLGLAPNPDREDLRGVGVLVDRGAALAGLPWVHGTLGPRRRTA